MKTDSGVGRRRHYVRIVRKQARRTYGQRLEDLARSLLAAQPNGTESGLGLRRQVELALDQLQGVRDLHRALHRGLLRQECYIRTDLLGLLRRTSQYDSERFEGRERLHKRLAKIEEERRKLASQEFDRLKPLHDRLLDLCNHHILLEGRPSRKRPRAGSVSPNRFNRL